MGKISVTAHYESEQRSRAANNSRLGLLNVQTIELSGRPHPVLSNILTTQEVMKSRIQCYQSIETNIGDHFYARTKLKLANRALWVARESSEEDPMTFIFDEILNLCEPEKFCESFASCRPATEEKKQDQ